MTDLAYAPLGALDTLGSAAVVSTRLAQLDVVSLRSDVLEAQVLAVPGTHSTHPVRYQGAAIDIFQEETGRVQDGIQGDDWWQVTIQYADSSFTAAKGKAKTFLRQYYRDYITSQFTVAPDDYPMDATSQMLYLLLDMCIKDDPADIDGFYVFDTTDVSHEITSVAAWEGVVGKIRNVVQAAANNAEAAWATIDAIPTDPPPGDGVDQIRAAIAALPAIPGS